jgi:hypothetical protein
MTEVGGTFDLIARYRYSTDHLTLSSGPLFHLDINSTQGWPAHECLVPDAALFLIDEQGKDVAVKFILSHFGCFLLSCIAEGGLVIKSHTISKGYLRFDNSAFKMALTEQPPSILETLMGAAVHFEITRAIASALHLVARVLVLKGQQIPTTKKVLPSGSFRRPTSILASPIDVSDHESEADIQPTEDLFQGKPEKRCGRY